MDSESFDRLTRNLATTLRGRRQMLWAAAGTLAALIGRAPAAAACVRPGRRCEPGERCCGSRCQGGRCRCAGNQKLCGGRCIPQRDCCTNQNCGPSERCVKGACESCLAQGTTCTDDAACCTGICDTYTNKCQQVRVYCNDGESCPGGRCCEAFGDKYCLYETATQRTCEPETECGYLLCGDRCSDLADETYQYCGYEGSAACRRGRCCCPAGIPLANCPNLQSSDPNAKLPRCRD